MKKKPDFFAAFASLPVEHKATVVVALRMYAQTMKVGFGAVTFSQDDIEKQIIFDEIGASAKLDPSKALDFARRLEQELLISGD